MPTLRIFWAILGLTLLTDAPVRAAPPVDFQKDVQPILSEFCVACHGIDAKHRKANLRLDDGAAVLKGGESGEPTLVPGHPEKSELYLRITSKEEEKVMPPRSEKKTLSPAQLQILKQWIVEGAKYEKHWAFTTPKKSPLPGGETGSPIDAFVRARLLTEKLRPSPPANSAALCRRIYLDLIGLPPSPAELTAFEKEGLNATIEKLLQSERYGEKWARHWLDLARYSDTNGYEKDMPRDMWKWRDWVIESLNTDMPYDKFIIEQVAGDLLPNATQQQLIATGFLRNSMINEEGAIVPEQFRMVEMFDRIDCIGKAVLGMSTQCAQCHTHKFDPITHHDYYGLMAFLNNTYEAQSWVYTADQLKQIEEIRKKIQMAESRIRQQRRQWESELNKWSQEVSSRFTDWKPLEAIELGSISGLNHPTQEADKSLLMKGHPSDDVFLIASPKLDGVTGLQFEVLTHRDLPHNGPGRSSQGTWNLRELEVFIKKPDGTNWEKQKLANASADYSAADNKPADGKNASGSVGYIIDGREDTTWNSDRGQGLRNQPSVAVVQFEKPLQFPEGTQMKVAWRMGAMIGCARISITNAGTPKAPAIDQAAILALHKPVAKRTTGDTDVIFTAWRKSQPDLKAINEEIAGLYKSLPAAPTSILHLAERETENQRVTHLLNRGEWDQPREVVTPITPEALHSFPADAPRNRLGFARWLADSRSPLTARVAVNQTWQAIFGTGLVETSEDFGTRAPIPEYRDLLDWLAVDFMEHNWSRKHLIRTILSSATYQQSSALTPLLMEKDPRNRLLARGPRFRADAEVVRDIALTASGLLTNKLGGPSVIPPVPKNVLDYNYTYPGYWNPATGPERYRRSVYMFRKRSMPDPVLSNFDGPNGDFSCARRIRSNTPLAALTGLNEPIFVEAAQAMALRVLKEGGTNDATRIDHAFLLCTSRKPTPEEKAEVERLIQHQRQRLAEGWLNPREILTGDSAKLPSLPEKVTPQDAAAWTLVSRVLLNLDETISKN
ncbi:PSD1 domain-containing protein [Telmatocola sphagniphila]|uniref:PSD1 domain-containing protein n=1 Tax=Telmatocola sphagniphila TaxID=1123043 RepID=A0A8E6B261_9BACT|nr:PSD1 and planctomycete cytochrome C domain-containing protein [Telmatocola sphagniphila]QVL30014.1 PSD1 domain-containing protein [Telmatocola sphagniphila]